MSQTTSEIPKRYLPFVRNNDKWDTAEKIRTYLFAVVVFPFRILATFLLLTWYLLSLKLGLFTFSGTQDMNKPVRSTLQKWVIQMAQPMARCLLYLMGFYHIKVNGDSSLTQNGVKANIIVMNHLSWLDILVMMAMADGIPGFVAKRETQNIPYIGYKSKVWQCIYVDNRLNKTTGNNVTEHISARATQDDMPPILIFPEGTTTNGKYLMKFRTGAFVGGHAVKPCCIQYPAPVFSPTWETISGFYHAFRLFTQVQNYCEINWLPVYVPNEEEVKNPSQYASSVCNLMAKAMNVEIIDTTFSDKIEYHKLIGRKK